MTRQCCVLLSSLAVAIAGLPGLLHGQFLYVAQNTAHLPITIPSALSGYTRDPSTGFLTPIPGSPFLTSKGWITSLAVDPKGKFLYVTRAIGPNYPSDISVFRIDPATGALTPIPGSPFSADYPISIVISPNGKFAYVGDLELAAGQPGMSVYAIDSATGALTLLQQLSNGEGDNLAIDPAGTFVYAFSSYPLSEILGYAIDAGTGTLSPLPGTTPGNTIQPYRPLAMHPSGRFVYEPSGTVFGYSIDPNTGALTPVPGAQPSLSGIGLASMVDNSGRFLYIGEQGLNYPVGSIAAFAVDVTTGSLAPIATIATLTDFPAESLAEDCTGKLLYSAEAAGNVYGQALIGSYTIDPVTGALTGVLDQYVQGASILAFACTTPGPQSYVAPLPAAVHTASFEVQWAGADTLSMISAYTIYVSDNGGQFTPWLTQTPLNEAMYPGVSGHTYGFYSIAQDVAGNVEASKSAAEATTLVDATPPVSRVSSLPASETSPNFPVQWSGTDAGGPGLATYNIYVSDLTVGSGFSIWQANTKLSQAWYAGTIGHQYGFFSQATDVDGEQENLKSAAEASTQTPPPPMAQDVNGDGQINCLDADLVKASFGQKDNPPGSNPADVNKDGVVNVLDLALVTQKMIPGTVCQ